MPTKRHEELRAFGHRILSYMGMTEIRNEETINIKLPNGKSKRYRVDIIGEFIKKKITENTYDLIKKTVIIEIGCNEYTKINNLRMAGYLTLVIPYSEKEEEWQDDKKLLQIMVDSNQELYNQLQTFLNKYIQIADEKLEKIDKYNQRINSLNSARSNIDYTRLSKLLKKFQEGISNLKLGEYDEFK